MRRASVVFALALYGCSDDAPPAVKGDTPDLTALQSIAVTPPRATLALVRGMTTAQALRVVGTYASGQPRDITAAAAWSVSGPPASVRGGMFTTSVPGSFTVSASVGMQLARATVDVRATGDLVRDDVSPDAAARLAGATAAGEGAVQVAYPLEGAIFPANLGDAEVQVTKTHASQSIARVWFSGTHIDLSLVARCTAIPNAPMGCAVTIDRALIPLLVGASEGAEMNLRVRLVAPDGTHLAESAAREVRWTSVNLTGALYYWSTRLGANATAIYRYNLAAQLPPEPFFLQTRDAPVVAGERPCVGCHSVSRDGRRMALSFGGSDPGNFGVYDIATRRPIATRLGDHAYGAPATFAQMSALNPDGTRVITTLRGVMTMRRVDDTLAPVGTALFATGLTPGDRATQPYWSPDGRVLAFVGFNPAMYDCNNPPCGDNRPRDNGDLAPYGQVYVAPVDGERVGAPRLLVSRSTEMSGRAWTSHYPSVSDDGRWVAFNRVRCDARGNDQGYAVDRTGAAANCSGYDNPGTRVMLVATAGSAAPIDLARLNGTDTWTNSWPRWAPDHGRFRGTELYWVAFSSKRPYGLRLPGDNTGRAMNGPPQLWFAALTLGEGDVLTGDPSHAPIWMPRQNVDESTPSGNHVPQWTAVFVPTPE